MFSPSRIKHIKPLKLVERFPGCYVVENAYDGIYEFFSGCPLAVCFRGRVIAWFRGSEMVPEEELSCKEQEFLEVVRTKLAENSPR